MKYINRILLLLTLGYSCLGALILFHIAPSYLHFSSIKSKWVLVWEDDFQGSKLNSTQWAMVESGGGYNESYRYRTEIAAFNQENVTVKNGCLMLASKQREWIGEDIFHPGQTIAGQYTSGQVVTKHAYAWGRYEIRAKLPSGQGLFPYVSLYPYNEDVSYEILIVGMLGYDPYSLYMSNYWGANQRFHFLNNDIFNRVKGPDYSNDFHTFAIEIEPGKIIWYVDKVRVFQTKRNIPNIPLCLNLGTIVGGGIAGNPSVPPKYGGRGTSLPQYFLVDWVRIYRKR